MVHTRIKGDLNNDGKFSGADVVFLASWFAEDENIINSANADPYFRYKADVNNDGVLEAADLVYMASVIANIEGYVIEEEPEPEPEP